MSHFRLDILNRPSLLGVLILSASICYHSDLQILELTPRICLVATAKFDLETLQLDAVNAFVHAELLDETVFMRMPPGYTEQGKVLRQKVPQEPCIVQKNGIICFFYVDDIVFAYRKERGEEVKRTIVSLSEALTLKDKGELKWFLGLNVIRNRSNRTMWLS